MRISFDFFSEPISFENYCINTVCIENKTVFSNTIKALREGTAEENNIIFSKDFKPIKMKNNIDFIFDFYALDFSSSFFKKIYEDMSLFCNDNLQENTVELKRVIINFLDTVNTSYDFDFAYNIDLNLCDFFKSQGFKPALENNRLIENLLDYILLAQKYSAVRCFILLTPSLYFTDSELELFLKEMSERNINICILENIMLREKTQYEKLTILDNDLCEIIESI